MQIQISAGGIFFLLILEVDYFSGVHNSLDEIFFKIHIVILVFIVTRAPPMVPVTIIQPERKARGPEGPAR